MTRFEASVSRRDALKIGGAGAVGLVLAPWSSLVAEAANSAVTLNWETWNDHYLPAQLASVRKPTGINAVPNLQTDDSDGYLKVKQTGSQYDIVSADALWIPKYHKDGLTQSFDINAIPAAKQLYSIARQFSFWKDGSN